MRMADPGGASRVLDGTPALALQAVLAALAPRDIAAVNAASRCMHASIAHATPVVCLRLSEHNFHDDHDDHDVDGANDGGADRGSRVQACSGAARRGERDEASAARSLLHAWGSATQRLAPAPAARIELAGCITAGGLRAALLKLARAHPGLRQLALVPMRRAASRAAAEPRDAASLESLAPLDLLAAQLTSLTLAQGLTLRRGLADGPASGQLPRLPALLKLHAASGAWGTPYAATLGAHAAFAAVLPFACPRITELSLQLPGLAKRRGGGGGGGGSGGSEQTCRAAAGAAVALIAAAAAALPHLRQLDLSALPDAWAPQHEHTRGSGSGCGSTGAGMSSNPVTAAAASASAPCARRELAAAAIDRAATALREHAREAAASGLPLQQQLSLPPGCCLETLEALGAWLLSALPQLWSLDLATAGGGWALRWRRPATSGTGGGATAPSSVTASCRAHSWPSLLSFRPGAEPTGPSSNTAAVAPAQEPPLPPSVLLPGAQARLECALGRHVASPTDALGVRVASLSLTLAPALLGGLGAALAGAHVLRHLRLSLLATSRSSAPLAELLRAACAAADASGRLESLALLPGTGMAVLAPGLLEPLAARCATTLRELRAVGCFALPAHGDAAGGSSGGSSGGMGRADAAWHGLAQLTSLTQLTLHQLGAVPLPLPVAALPRSLRALECRQLLVLAPVAGQAGGGDGGAAAAAAGLRQLRLHDCELQDAASLGGAELRSLSVARSGWPGGWRAAATAWPCVAELALCCPRGRGALPGAESPGSAQRGGAATSDALLAQLLSALPRLAELQVTHLPCLTGGGLALLATRLRRVSVSAAAVHARAAPRAAAGLAAAGRAAATGLELRLPAGSRCAARELAAALRTALPWAAVAAVADQAWSGAGLCAGAC